LVTIVDKAMARDPDARYQDAGELAEDLRRFTTGQLVRAHRYDRLTLIRRWLRRNRAAVTVAVVLLALLVAFAIVSVRRILAETPPARAEQEDAERERAEAVHQTELTKVALATALYQKGRVAETGREWTRAAMFYAAARESHDTAEAKWAAGLAEARAI